MQQPGRCRFKGMHYWFPMLAMHTGCRARELGGPRGNEVRLGHEYPHMVIQDNTYRTTKGSYRRNIPILDGLLNFGFGEFVERMGHGKKWTSMDFEGRSGHCSDDPNMAFSDNYKHEVTGQRSTSATSVRSLPPTRIRR